MATQRQESAFKEIVVNGSNKKDAMIKAGYSPNTAIAPTKLTKSNGWQELMDKYMPEDKLAKIHKKLLEKEEVLTRNNNATKQVEQIKTGQPHSDVKGALDMAYKLRGNYTPQNIDVTSKGEQIAGINYITPEDGNNHKTNSEATPSLPSTED